MKKNSPFTIDNNYKKKEKKKKTPWQQSYIAELNEVEVGTWVLLGDLMIGN